MFLSDDDLSLLEKIVLVPCALIGGICFYLFLVGLCANFLIEVGLEHKELYTLRGMTSVGVIGFIVMLIICLIAIAVLTALNAI